MEFIPYKANECFEHLYYQIPMELFFNKNYKDKLNSDSKILYEFLLNRLTLSRKNNWFDEEGNVFLIFTRKEVQELLNLSDKTATKAFNQLMFKSAQLADNTIYYARRKIRDDEARNAFFTELEKEDVNGIYMRDIIREEMKSDDVRLR